MSNEYGAIPLSTANAVGASLKKKMGSLTGFAPVDWAETINKLGNKLPERTVSGAVCSFSDGADDVPMPSVKASITAVQAGSGDPSPSNVRAISGFAECDVTHAKKNLFYPDNAVVFPVSENGIECPSVTSGNKNTVIWNGRLGLGKWTIKENAPNASNSTHQLVLSKNGTTMRYITTDPYTFTVDNEEDSYRVRLYVYANNTETYLKPQLERGDTATTYEPYYGETMPIWMGGKNLFPYISTFPYSGSMSAYFKEFTANGTNQKLPAIHLKEGVTYTLSADVTSTVQPFKFSVGAGSGSYSTDIETASNLTNGRVSVTFTPTASNLSSGDLLAFRLPRYGSSTSADITITNVQLELGDTATTFEPVRYIYGGELNLTTGVLTVTHGMVSFKNQSVAWSSNAASTDGYIRYNTPITDKANGYDLLCDTFPVLSSVIPSSPTEEGVSGFTNNILYVSIATSRLSGDLSTTSGRRTAFNNWIDANQLNVVYELATPTTIQLTAEEVRSFLGMNNLWANTGDSEVTYFAQPSGGITPVFTEEVICDNSSASSTLTFTEDWHDYDFLQFKLTNSSSGIITYITTTPDILDEIFAKSSSKVLFNEFSNDQYALYTKSSDLSWSRSGTRNVNVTEVKGLTATNCTVSTEWIYKRGAITASNVTITAPKYFEDYDEIYVATCDGDSDDTMPCILPVRAGCAGYNFYGNNGRNCVRLTGNTATDTYGKDETKNIFCMMGINYEEV